MKCPNIKEIEEGRLKILENGLELIDEAELLFNNQRYARAYSLSHLATEELMKIPMLNTIEYKLILGIEINWKKSEKNLRDHKSKISESIVFDYFQDPDEENDADVKRYFEELKKIDNHNKLKNDGFYVGLLEDTFIKPSDIIDSDLARKSLYRAKKFYAILEPVEKGMKGQIEEMVKNSENFVRMINDEKSDIYMEFHKLLKEERSEKN